MINLKLLSVCLLLGGAALLVFELLWHRLEKILRIKELLPEELRENDGTGYFFSRFLMQLAFVVVLPAVVYSWFYVLVPFYGIRAGISLALMVFVLGILPFAGILLLRVRLSMSYILFQMAGHLLKLLLVYAVIAYLYIL